MQISLPYGRTHLTAELDDQRINAVLRSRLESYVPTTGESELVEAALAAVIDYATQKLGFDVCPQTRT